MLIIWGDGLALLSIDEWQLFISQICLIKHNYGHEGMRDTFSLVCVQNDWDSTEYPRNYNSEWSAQQK